MSKRSLKFLAETVWPLAASIALVCTMCSRAKADEAAAAADTARKPFTVQFRPLKHDVLAAEILWQGENIVDLQQTLRIARNPYEYQEIGTISYFAGNHPSVHQVWWISGLFGVAHYGVTQLLTNAHWDTAARVWSYTSLGAKTVNMQRNAHLGLGY